MEEKKIFDQVVNNFKRCFPEITAERISSLSAEEYNQLLMEVAGKMFDEGRYNLKSEMCLEIIDIPEVEETISDQQAFNGLPDEDKAIIGFWMRLQQFTYPIFKCRKPDLGMFPWNFQNTEYSIANKELRTWLFDCRQKNFVAAILDSIFHFMLDNKMLNSVAQDTLAHKLRGIKLMRNDRVNSEEEINDLLVRIDDVLEEFYKIHNHNEIGKRLGFCYKQQLLYDAIDSFIYTQYDYRQVDMVKQLWQWIGENWDYGKEKHTTEEKQAVVNEVERLAKEHGIQFQDEDYTMIVIIECVLETDAIIFKESSDKELDGEYWEEEELDEEDADRDE